MPRLQRELDKAILSLGTNAKSPATTPTAAKAQPKPPPKAAPPPPEGPPPKASGFKSSDGASIVPPPSFGNSEAPAESVHVSCSTGFYWTPDRVTDDQEQLDQAWNTWNEGDWNEGSTKAGATEPDSVPAEEEMDAEPTGKRIPGMMAKSMRPWSTNFASASCLDVGQGTIGAACSPSGSLSS